MNRGATISLSATVSSPPGARPATLRRLRSPLLNRSAILLSCVAHALLYVALVCGLDRAERADRFACAASRDSSSSALRCDGSLAIVAPEPLRAPLPAPTPVAARPPTFTPPSLPPIDPDDATLPELADVERVALASFAAAESDEPLVVGSSDDLGLRGIAKQIGPHLRAARRNAGSTAPTSSTPMSSATTPAPAANSAGGDANDTPIADVAPGPSYPRRAVSLRLQGDCTLLALVKADGSVDACQVESSSGHALLDDAARDALLQWHFKPHVVDGTPRPFTVRVPFHFFIPDAQPSDAAPATSTPPKVEN